jgi:hypothetical protein
MLNRIPENADTHIATLAEKAAQFHGLMIVIHD